MATATVTSKGQITVPKVIRDRLGIAPGDKIEFIERGSSEIVLRKRRTLSLGEVLGSLPSNGVRRTLEAMEEDLGYAIVESVLRR